MMSSPDPGMRGLDDCGCCEGVGAETPVEVWNRAGLAAIARRIGTHARFKESMLARLSSRDLPALRSLTTRDDADFSIAILDAWATTADILTFYQERIANESYLRTATERRSLAHLGRLTGYEPAPGVAATAYLAFALEDAEGAPEEVTIGVGTRVQSVPGPGERPQTFESVEEIVARPEWNGMKPILVQKHPELAADTKTLTVQGTGLNINRGDSLLLVTGGAAADRHVKQVLGVTSDNAAQTTRLDLTDDPPPPPAFVFPTLVTAQFIVQQLKLTTSTVKSAIIPLFSASALQGVRWKQADLTALAKIQKWPIRKLMTNIATLVEERKRTFPPETGAFRFRQRAAVFGHNAPRWETLPGTQRFGERIRDKDNQDRPIQPAYPENWETKNKLADDSPSANDVHLDNVYSGIVAKGWLVLEGSGQRQIYRVVDHAEVSLSRFTLNAKVSRVSLDHRGGFGAFTRREATVLAESEKLTLADLPVIDVVQGNEIVLDRIYLGLAVGRPVVVSGLRADLDGVRDSEVMTLADVELKDGLTVLTFETGLAHQYVRGSVTVNANVALATHGETKTEALGSGDTRVAFQRFTLRQPPLTYVPAATPIGAATTLEVRVNGEKWQEVPNLYDRAPDDRVYITRQEEDGRTTVVFGDGRTGSRLPSGLENVSANYRQGMGEAGLVDEGSLTLLLTRPLGVRSVNNPVAAADAADPETVDQLRRTAPLRILTLDRIVSLQDYEDFARAFAGVAKALATWTWDGRARGVFVTVAGPNGRAIEPDSQTARNLLDAMRKAGDPRVRLRVKTFAPAFFRVAGAIKVAPTLLRERVLAEVEAALRQAFSFDPREFGQPVALSEVIASIHGVAGVLAVDIDAFSRTDAETAGASPPADAAAETFPPLLARLPRAGAEEPLPAELLLLDPRPLQFGTLT